MSSISSQIPSVTVLCGFLGAGKTTLLQQVLKTANGRKWAAVVNDVASMNIDGRLVQKAGASQVIEMANGCVCCSMRDELAETVAELAGSGNYAHIFIETTGVAEPRGIAALFTRTNAYGRTLSDFATLHGMVTVVDAAQLERVWREEVEESSERVSRERQPKEVVELMFEQVECADVLVLNKTDLVDPDAAVALTARLHELNPRADIFTVTEGRVPDYVVPGPRRFDARETIQAARWLRVLSGENSVMTSPIRQPVESTPWSTMVFQARRPFDESKFRELIARQYPGVLRVKGFFWVSSRHDDMGYLSVAGGIARWEYVGTWAAAMLERGLISETEIPESAKAIWEEPSGDRRQELAFIGLNLNLPALRADLEALLESPQE